jgi:signal transduction histidine kinase
MFQNERLLSIVWILGALYISVISSTIFAVINALAPIQLMILFSNMMIIAIVFRWQIVLFMLFVGVFLTAVAFKIFGGVTFVDIGLVALEFKILYCFLLFSCVLLAFLKPLQQDTDRKIKLFCEAEQRIKDMSEQILNLLIMKQEFINNINYEIRNPVHHIGSSVYLLHKDWGIMKDEERKDNIDIIYQGYKKIAEYIENILDLSELSTNKIKLNYKSVNLAHLAQKILDDYRRFHLDNSDVFNFSINVDLPSDTLPKHPIFIIGCLFI